MYSDMWNYDYQADNKCVALAISPNASRFEIVATI